MSNLYNSLKKGYKVIITSDINQRCRDYLVSNEWDDSRDAVETILIKVYRNRFLQSLTQNANITDLSELDKVLEDKIADGLKSFKYQKPTANQVYRYVEACLKNGEAPKRIMTNYEIWQEISRLEKLIK